MGYNIVVLHSIISIFVVTAQDGIPIQCGNVRTGDLRGSGDNVVHFMFTITSNINHTWFSTCGSALDLHTHLKVTKNNTLIANNSGADSPCFFNKAFLDLSHLSSGDYQMELSAGNVDTVDLPTYSLQMFCNNFNGWPESSNCNHVSGFAINVCASWENLQTGERLSSQFTCNDKQPVRTIYNGSACSGSVIRNESSVNYTSSYTCDAPTNCKYASVTTRMSPFPEQNVCIDDSIGTREKLFPVIDVCMPGNVKSSCSGNSLKQEIHPDVLCSQTAIVNDMHKEECFNFTNFFVYIEDIKCPTGESPSYLLGILLSSGAGGLLIIGCLYVCWRRHCSEYGLLHNGRNGGNVELTGNQRSGEFADLSSLLNK